MAMCNCNLDDEVINCKQNNVGYGIWLWRFVCLVGRQPPPPPYILSLLITD